MSQQEPTRVTIETSVHAPMEKVWQAWTMPEHITRWNAASEDWHAPRAENDLRVGGVFRCRMEAKDGSAGFDFGGVYTDVVPQERIAYVLDDQRTVEVQFTVEGNAVHIVETFVAEETNPVEMQRAGWQAILNNFKQYVEQS